jgi:hypothetical protein
MMFAGVLLVSEVTCPPVGAAGEIVATQLTVFPAGIRNPPAAFVGTPGHEKARVIAGTFTATKEAVAVWPELVVCPLTVCERAETARHKMSKMVFIAV